jgi:hypothetical protein
MKMTLLSDHERSILSEYLHVIESCIQDGIWEGEGSEDPEYKEIYNSFVSDQKVIQSIRRRITEGRNDQ